MMGASTSAPLTDEAHHDARQQGWLEDLLARPYVPGPGWLPDLMEREPRRRGRAQIPETKEASPSHGARVTPETTRAAAHALSARRPWGAGDWIKRLVKLRPIDSRITLVLA
jgi:hypothetical protein